MTCHADVVCHTRWALLVVSRHNDDIDDKIQGELLFLKLHIAQIFRMFFLASFLVIKLLSQKTIACLKKSPFIFIE